MKAKKHSIDNSYSKTKTIEHFHPDYNLINHLITHGRYLTVFPNGFVGVGLIEGVSNTYLDLIKQQQSQTELTAKENSVERDGVVWVNSFRSSPDERGHFIVDDDCKDYFFLIDLERQLEYIEDNSLPQNTAIDLRTMKCYSKTYGFFIPIAKTQTNN